MQWKGTCNIIKLVQPNDYHIQLGTNANMLKQYIEHEVVKDESEIVSLTGAPVVIEDDLS